MKGSVVAITRYLSVDSKSRGTGDILSQVRNKVLEIRKNNPELSDYRLYDVGLIFKDEEMVINLYFLPEESRERAVT